MSVLEITASIDSSPDKIVRVLHVDDDAFSLKTTKQCLELKGDLHVETAHSALEAMKKMKQEKFDVIVSDYQMPDKDGLELLMELRANGNMIPFILFTGKGKEEVAVKALNLVRFDMWTNMEIPRKFTVNFLPASNRHLVSGMRRRSCMRAKNGLGRSMTTSRTAS